MQSGTRQEATREESLLALIIALLCYYLHQELRAGVRLLGGVRDYPHHFVVVALSTSTILTRAVL